MKPCSIFLLDRYFLSVPALKKLAELNRSSGAHVELVTKAKKSCCAYEKPPIKKPGRERPQKKGKAVKLSGLFAARKDSFREAKACIYGKEEDIRYYRYRFHIECTYRKFKQQLGGFCYRFRTKAIPRLNRYAKKGGKPSPGNGQQPFQAGADNAYS